MEEIFKGLSGFTADMITNIISGIYHNWLPLCLAVLTAAIMKVHIDTEKLKNRLLERPKISVLSSVAFGALTPLCACGTMAVVIGLLTTAFPWGPIMAFLISSPLMSPDCFILLAGIIGIRFAVALAATSIILGLASGFITHMIEKKTTFLNNQSRFQGISKEGRSYCQDNTPAATEICSCSDVSGINKQKCCKPEAVTTSLPELIKRAKLPETAKAMWDVGVRQILLYFTIFVAVGYLINYFIPTSIIMAMFSPESIFSVPLAALIGLPLYVSGESAVPLIQSLIAGGAGEEAMLAFMITGPATSAWVIAGVSAFMKKRAVCLYIVLILIGAILFGYLYGMVLLMGV